MSKIRLTDKEKEEKIFSLESSITIINEELSNAKGKNRRSLTVHYMDKLLDLFTQLKKYRRLTRKEKFALGSINLYVNKTTKNSRKIKQARTKTQRLVESGKLEGVELVDD